MIMQFLCRRDTKVSLYHMKNVELTFNDLPQVVAELRDEVIGMKVALLDLQKGQTKQKLERVRRTMNVEEAADYLRMPLNTLYMKLQKGEVPGSKPGKRWVLFNDELDKWLEVNGNMSDRTECTMYCVYKLYALKTMATMATVYPVATMATVYVYTAFTLATVYTTVTVSAMCMLSAMKTMYTEYSTEPVYKESTMAIMDKLYSRYTEYTRSIMAKMYTMYLINRVKL